MGLSQRFQKKYTKPRKVSDGPLGTARPPYSCDGVCGSYSVGYTCYCDWYCWDIGDCCNDFCDYCSAEEVQDAMPEGQQDDFDFVGYYQWCGDDCPSGNYDCTGLCDGTAVVDCDGTCDGSAVEDECGVCNGDGTTCIDECEEMLPSDISYGDMYMVSTGCLHEIFFDPNSNASFYDIKIQGLQFSFQFANNWGTNPTELDPGFYMDNTYTTIESVRPDWQPYTEFSQHTMVSFACEECVGTHLYMNYAELLNYATSGTPLVTINHPGQLYFASISPSQPGANGLVVANEMGCRVNVTWSAGGGYDYQECSLFDISGNSYLEAVCCSQSGGCDNDADCNDSIYSICGFLEGDNCCRELNCCDDPSICTDDQTCDFHCECWTTCFTAGTKVKMADGTEKNIEDIKVGDKLLGKPKETINVPGTPWVLIVEN